MKIEFSRNKVSLVIGFYFICIGFGAINVAKSISKFIFLNFLANPDLKSSLHPWVQFWWFPPKKYEILFFSLSLLAIFGVISLTLALHKKKWFVEKFNTLLSYKIFSYIYLFFLFTGNANNPTRSLAIEFPKGSIWVPAIDLAFWIFLLLVPLLASNTHLVQFTVARGKKYLIPLFRAWPKPLLLIGIVNILVIFAMLIFEKISLINDNMYLASYASLKGFNEPELSTYKRLNIYGFSEDPEKIPLTNPNNFSIPISNVTIWRDFIKSRPNMESLLLLDPFEKLLVPACYLNASEASSVSALMSAKEKEQFDIVQQRLSLRDWGRIHPISLLGLNINYADELLMFKIYNRWLLHHHNFTLGSMNEYLLGRPLSEVNIQYGLGFTMTIAKILKFFNRVTLDGYLHIWFIGYIFYFIFFLIIVHKMLGNLKYTAATCIIAALGLNNLLYDGFLRHPGFTPLRHFWDLSLFISFFFFLKTLKNRWLILAMWSTLLQILWSKDFGLPMACSLLSTIFLAHQTKALELSKKRALTYILFLVGLALTLTIPDHYSKSYLAQYYLQGLAGNELPRYSIQAIIFLSALAIASTLLIPNVKLEKRYSGLLLLFYLMCSFIYYVWGATEPHIWNLFPIIGFAGTFFFSIVSDYDFKFRKIKVISSVAAVLILFFYLKSATNYSASFSHYKTLLSNYNTFNWNFKRADVKSVVNPLPIEESLSLIAKYTPEEQKEIYIISKLDNILPFLSEKYSALPFPDLQWFLMSSKEDKEVEDKIKNAKPEYIFVDNELESTLLGQIVTVEECKVDQLHHESVNRVLRHQAMRRLFYAIKEDYAKIETSSLLSVYKRKNILGSRNESQRH